MWKAVGEWEKACSSDRAARVSFQRRAVALLEENTGLKLADKDATPPFLYSYTAGDLLVKTAFQQAFGLRQSTDLENDMLIDTATGVIKCRGQILGEFPGEEEKCRQGFLLALEELQASPELQHVRTTYGALGKAALKVRRHVEQIRLLGMIPGQCQICSRLGM